MTPEKVRQNLEALIHEGARVLASKRVYELDPSAVDETLASQWSINVMAMLRSTFGENSDHYRAAKERAAILLQHSRHDDALKLQGMAKAALAAWDNGYVFELRQLAEADVEASLIEQAEELLSKGYYQAAAVLAGAVMEQHLRSLCAKYAVSALGANGKPKTMEPLNQDLCRAGAYNTLQQKQITHLAGIRNEAAHGNPVTADDAKRLVQDALSLCGKLT